MVSCYSLWCWVCSLLVYSSFPLNGIAGVMSLLITLPGASGSKAQMVVPCDAVEATVPLKPKVTQVFLEVVRCSQRSLCNPGGQSGLLTQGLLAWACSCRGHWLGSEAAEVALLGQLHQMSLAQVQSHRGCWFRPGPSEVAPSYLLLQRLLAQQTKCFLRRFTVAHSYGSTG